MGTFRLAKALMARGHAVTYLGNPNVSSLVQEQGFAFIPFPPEPTPGGEGAQSQPDRTVKTRWWSQRWRNEMAFRRYTQMLVDGTLDQRMASGHPDLVLCDAFLWSVALRALSMQIPTIQMSTSLFTSFNSQIPPAITAMPPARGPWSARLISMAWVWMHLKHVVTKRWASVLLGSYRAPLRMHHLTATFHWVARHSGRQCKHNRDYVLDEIGPHLILPEIVLCPKAFQFPGKLPAHRHYYGDFIDLDRQEPDLPFDPRHKTIVFCSLGTSARSYNGARRFFTAAALASRHHPEWFFVVHISDADLIEHFTSTENLLILPWVAQLSLLRHTAVMVTHGGLNSIMECIHNQVPMVIVPCARDQPGNAARAAFHGIAVRAEIRHLDSAHLSQLIAKALQDQTMKECLKQMKASIQSGEGIDDAVEFIESMATGPAMPAM
ncbi:glycosyltransferase [Cyanobium sp. PCC 7001]|uniref:glycosyltransferase n=1 Tax=Cyanobium sp. PCC 7001 TaxID=180281 RepID=UPI0018DD08BB|nr:glycosyltransferase [Cyanobium sp. PCC 7001]